MSESIPRCANCGASQEGNVTLDGLCAMCAEDGLDGAFLDYYEVEE